MKRLIVVTEAVQKKGHSHKLHPKDSYCPVCGEQVIELMEYSAEQCKRCLKTILPSYQFCPGCGEPPGTVDEEHYVFLGVPLVKEDYEATLAHLGTKEFTLTRKQDGKGWNIAFKEGGE